MGSRAKIEQLLVSRRAATMAFVGLPVTYAGSNTALNDPIGYAVRQLGGTTADPTNVTDADINPMIVDPAIGWDAVLDVAELRLLMSIKGNLDTVDITSGPFTEKYSQLANMLDKDIKLLSDQVEVYGIAKVLVEAGTIQLNIGSRFDDLPPTTVQLP